jgi:hypothetical protein
MLLCMTVLRVLDTVLERIGGCYHCIDDVCNRGYYSPGIERFLQPKQTACRIMSHIMDSQLQ